jgi:3-dehydroquinate synthase
MKANIFLTGFSGTGKSSVGRELAKRLGYEFIDTDLQIEQNTGRSVPEIFSQDGEEAFRRIESDVLVEVCRSDLQVVSTGGGVALSQENRVQMTANGYVVCLEARPETLYVRLLLDTNTRQDKAERPLLKGGDPFQRIATLKAERQPFYAEADWTIHTDFMSPVEVADEIQHALDIITRRSEGAKGGAGSPATPGSPHAARPAVVAPKTSSANILTVKTSSVTYPVVFGVGLVDKVGVLLQEQLPSAQGQRIFVISDTSVGPLYGARVRASLEAGGWAGRVFYQEIPAGEESKNLSQVSALYDWLIGERAERKDVIIAVGGGVVGDLSGFVASSWLRGLPFVQIPTTLLAMVDSSIGGKTGVNHAKGKNLIGAFYQPRLVLEDVSVVASLPDRVRRAGWAETIKHAIIPGADRDASGALSRFSQLEADYDYLLAGEPTSLLSQVLRDSVAVKAGVVAEDEYETGLRMTLNYGHTYGHALEAAGNYQTLLHGEAVAIGMHGEAKLALRLGLCDASFVERQRRLIERYGLPLSVKVDKAKALAALKLDKKVESGSIRWIMPREIGVVEICNDIPNDLVQAILDEIIED